MPDISCLPLTLYFPITLALLSLLKTILIPREVLTDLVAAVGLGYCPGTVSKGSEIKRFFYSIACERLRIDVTLALEDAKVGSVHDHETAASTREDVETPTVEAISLISLAHRLMETEEGKELLENVHNVIDYSVKSLQLTPGVGASSFSSFGGESLATPFQRNRCEDRWRES